MRGTYKTAQREAIIDCLRFAHGHMTAAAVHKALLAAGHKVSAATVYRQLEKLVSEDVVIRSTPAGEKSACFELVDSSSCHPGHCYHMKCTTCGRLIHLDCEKVEELSRHMLEEHGFVVDTAATVFFGTCAECARKAASRD